MGGLGIHYLIKRFASLLKKQLFSACFPAPLEIQCPQRQCLGVQSYPLSPQGWGLCGLGGGGLCPVSSSATAFEVQFSCTWCSPEGRFSVDSVFLLQECKMLLPVCAVSVCSVISGLFQRCGVEALWINDFATCCWFYPAITHLLLLSSWSQGG